MGIQEVPLGKLLEANEAFQGKWNDMLEAGGEDIKKLFAPMVERAAKRARDGPYATGGAHDS